MSRKNMLENPRIGKRYLMDGCNTFFLYNGLQQKARESEHEFIAMATFMRIPTPEAITVFYFPQERLFLYNGHVILRYSADARVAVFEPGTSTHARLNTVLFDYEKSIEANGPMCLQERIEN